MKDITWYKLSDDWIGINKIIIYGYGRVAQRNIEKLKSDFDIKIIIDSNPDWKLIGNRSDIEIKSLEDAKDLIKYYKIVVTTSSLAYGEIKDNLSDIGLKEYKDFCRLETFMLEWYWRSKGEVCISQVFSAVTTKCTFRCKYCSNLMPYFKKQYDYTANDILDDLKLLFKRIDYLSSYYIIGGEPFLNKELIQILSEVYRNFGDKIGYIQIITNGSVLPSKPLLHTIRECKVKVRISDYRRNISYNSKFQEVIQAFENENIEYSISDYKTWSDLGFPHENIIIKNNLHQHMLDCSQGCHSINDKKFYYCGTLWDAEKSGLYSPTENDYIDLQKTGGNLEDDKIQILKYCLGILEGESISLCAKCRGFGKDNSYLVDVAEQMEDKIFHYDI